jgi:glycine/D-amino acid oxidase-like deaminating enzyme
MNLNDIAREGLQGFCMLKRRVVVIGCGVVGLTTALILLREGHEVTIVSKDTPPDTTSNAAGAFWNPVFRYSGGVATCRKIQYYLVFCNVSK